MVKRVGESYELNFLSLSQHLSSSQLPPMQDRAGNASRENNVFSWDPPKQSKDCLPEKTLRTYRYLDSTGFFLLYPPAVLK